MLYHIQIINRICNYRVHSCSVLGSHPSISQVNRYIRIDMQHQPFNVPLLKYFMCVKGATMLMLRVLTKGCCRDDCIYTLFINYRTEAHIYIHEACTMNDLNTWLVF